MLRKWAAIIASAALLMSSTMALANDAHPAQQQGALAPGKAAGVEKAVGEGTNVLLIVVGIGLVVGGVALALSSSGGGSGGSTTSTN